MPLAGSWPTSPSWRFSTRPAAQGVKKFRITQRLKEAKWIPFWSFVSTTRVDYRRCLLLLLKLLAMHNFRWKNTKNKKYQVIQYYCKFVPIAQAPNVLSTEIIRTFIARVLSLQYYTRAYTYVFVILLLFHSRETIIASVCELTVLLNKVHPIKFRSVSQLFNLIIHHRQSMQTTLYKLSCLFQEKYSTIHDGILPLVFPFLRPCSELLFQPAVNDSRCGHHCGVRFL